jgi:hypothetical protein
MIHGNDILAITQAVTKPWTKQIKAEERGRRSRASREYIYSDRVNFTDVAHDILPAGYAHASGNGRYTVDKRQFYYAVRDKFFELTGREIKADYFSQTLLIQYMNQNPSETASWKITASPRGTLSIPNTGRKDIRIPCGTVAIEEYLAHRGEECDPLSDIEEDDELFLDVQWPSLAEGQRYQAVLYIEKEGFDPQLREARIADRFDVAIISCKGQSVTAARMYVDHVCRVGGGVPLFVAHDFDKAGFEISQRLTTVSYHAIINDLVKYEFQNKIKVLDLGLRLADVEEYGLKSETVRFKGGFARDSIATRAEQDFLRSNRRVELNAFTAPQFIEWIEHKLTWGLKQFRLGKRLIPDDKVLENAYRRALVNASINMLFEELRDQLIEDAKAAKLPKSLRKRVQAALKDPEAPAWDEIIYDLAKETLAWDDSVYDLANQMLGQMKGRRQ